jgi:RimJ/RimL family protein N-acetyltransferase
MYDLSQVALLPVTDAHFAGFLGEGNSPLKLSQPPGGIDSPAVLRMLRGMVARLHQAGIDGHWLILDGNEVVGLCGYLRPPDAAKSVEIGYGTAPERRNNGYATKAISLLLQTANADPAVGTILAETSINNPASRLVLQRNRFTPAGTREDAEEGILDLWRFDLSPRHAGCTINLPGAG